MTVIKNHANAGLWRITYKTACGLVFAQEVMPENRTRQEVEQWTALKVKANAAIQGAIIDRDEA